MKIALILTVLSLTTGVFAQTSDSFLLRGVVAKTCSVAITADPVAGALDLIGAGHAGDLVATLDTETNSSAGMQLSINADTAGVLVNQSDASQTIAYSLDYVGITSGSNSPGLVPAVAPANLDASAAPGELDGTLSINLTADPSLVDGSYEANVTVSCATL